MPESRPAHSELAAWLRLTLAPGVGGATQRALLAAFGLPEQILAQPPLELARVADHKQVAALLDDARQAEIEQALAWAAQPGNRILSLADPEYPQRLLESADPPVLLYAKGRLELLSHPALSIVGSRNATAQGLANAEAFASSLSAQGITIVSGLALGIDAAAHRGGLSGAGGTIAVIGTGPDRIYPAGNQALARRIAQEGLILSEFPLGTPPVAANFPRRNRLIAALGAGVLVVEAAEKSGSLITARLAGELGREVFALPGSIHSPMAKGCHRLIKDGAKLVDDARDILEELRLEGRPPSTAERRPKHSNGDGAAPPPDTALLDALGFDPCSLDTLVERTGLTPQALSAMLLQLEMDGLVAMLPGGRYQQIPKR